MCFADDFPEMGSTAPDNVPPRVRGFRGITARLMHPATYGRFVLTVLLRLLN